MIRFNSREKKPNIYSVAVLGAAAMLTLACSALEVIPPKAGNLFLALIFGAMAFCLQRAFRAQLEYNPYSYNTILYAGFTLFVLSLFGTHAWTAVRNSAGGEGVSLLYALVHSAKNYMLLTSPFLILFSAALFVSNLALIRHEGKRFVNILGILLALALICGEILVGFLDLKSALSADAVLLRSLTVNLVAAMYLYFECMIVGASVADVIAARYIPERDKDYLIVLGCGLKKDGRPTPLLKGRLDAAREFDRRQQEETGRRAVFVVSGGQGPDEVCPEAVSMRNYLVEQGVEPERILAEDRSRDTEENMRFSARLIGADARTKAAYFTTNYHVFRAGIKARRAGLHAQGMGAPTRWYFWPNAAVREFVGLLTEHKGKQALVLAGLLLCYGILTVVTFG